MNLSRLLCPSAISNMLIPREDMVSSGNVGRLNIIESGASKNLLILIALESIGVRGKGSLVTMSNRYSGRENKTFIRVMMLRYNRKKPSMECIEAFESLSIHFRIRSSMFDFCNPLFRLPSASSYINSYGLNTTTPENSKPFTVSPLYVVKLPTESKLVPRVD